MSASLQPIQSFLQDEQGQWIAVLGCGHTQHVRHDPPWQLRPWVTTEAGRSSMLGYLLPCNACAAAVPGSQ